MDIKWASTCGQDSEYQVGKHLFLKVSLWKKVLRFGYKSKHSPRFIPPYEVVERFDLVSYWVKTWFMLPSCAIGLGQPCRKLQRCHDIGVPCRDIPGILMLSHSEVLKSWVYCLLFHNIGMIFLILTTLDAVLRHMGSVL